jgi:hypothetical protein
MSEFDEIDSLKYGTEKINKFKEYYNNKVKINDWLNISSTNTIIRFKDRTEYKKHNIYHRLNGPAIDYNDEKLNKYYYKGVLYETKEEWQKITLKEARKIKIKKLNNSDNNE